MIRFEPRPKPKGFVERVEHPGAKWLATHTTEHRPRAYWREFLSQLQDAFGSLCAYGAMYEPVGTVDHFISLDEDRSKAYDWTNYRFASQWLNASKQNLKSNQLIDPFEVNSEWFEIKLPSLQLVMTKHVPDEWRERAAFMLKRLHLGHDERIIRQRQAWYRMYQNGKITLDVLAEMAPLIAAAVKKRNAITRMEAGNG